MGLDTRNNWEHFQDVPFNPLNTGFFYHFFGAIHASKQRCRKTVVPIFMKFSEKDGHDTGSNLEYFWDVTVIPLNPGSIYLFPGSVFVISWKNGWTDFHEIFMKRQAWHNKWLARLFHTCLDCFTVSHLGAQGVFVSNTTVKSMSGFSLNFQDMLAMTQEKIWNILGMIGLTPWTQGSFSYFLGLCLLTTSHNTVWMDIN